MGKRLINSREGKVSFDKPSMTLDLLMDFGRMVRVSLCAGLPFRVISLGM
jgi:hypothetical protein